MATEYKLSYTASEINNKLGKIDGHSNQITEISEDVTVLETRMNTFTALPEGTTTADSEIIDGRIDYKGDTHANIGTHIRKVTSELNDIINNLVEIENNTVITDSLFSKSGYYITNNGSFTPDNNRDSWRATEPINVENVDFIYVKTKTIQPTAPCIFFDRENQLIPYAYNNNISMELQEVKETFIVPYNAVTVCMTKLKEYDNNLFVLIKSDEDKENKKSKFVVCNSYINTTGHAISDAQGNFELLKLNCNKYKTIKYSLANIANINLISFYNFDGEYISGVAGYGTDVTLAEGVVKIPENTHHAVICEVSSTYATTFDYSKTYVYCSMYELEDDLSDYNWLAVGDSITLGETVNNYSYADYVKAKTNITLNKQAYSGYTLRALMQNWAATYDPSGLADVITLLAGTNDFNANRPLGTIDDGYEDNTFYGDLNTLCIYLLGTAYPTKVFILCTLLQRNYTGDNEIVVKGMTNNIGLTVNDYCEAIRNIGIKYSVPVIDLYSMSGITSQKIENLTTDGVHPNVNGQKRLASIFLNKLKEVLKQFEF